MIRAIVDTNVLVVANKSTSEDIIPSPECIINCVTKLQQLEKSGTVVLDDAWVILKQYLNNVAFHGQDPPGSVFLKWVMNNLKKSPRCEQHHLELEENGQFVDFPDDPELSSFDPDDRVFVALAESSGAPIWNATDSDWHHARKALHNCGIEILQLCPEHEVHWEEKAHKRKSKK